LFIEHVARSFATDWKEEPFSSAPQQTATQTATQTARSPFCEGGQRRHPAAWVMPSAAQGVSLVLSWRPDQERTRLPAGTGDLAVGFDF